MKKDTHPVYNDKVKVKCSNCGAVHEFGATSNDISIEICSKCHPAYTGKQTMVDTAGRVDKFKKRQAKATSSKSNKEDIVETTEEVKAA